MYCFRSNVKLPTLFHGDPLNLQDCSDAVDSLKQKHGEKASNLGSSNLKKNNGLIVGDCHSQVWYICLAYFFKYDTHIYIYVEGGKVSPTFHGMTSNMF